jgi:hypothetical protein
MNMSKQTAVPTAAKSRERVRNGKSTRKPLTSSHRPLAPEPDLKDLFINVLAEYLVKNQAEMSIRLEMNEPAALLWAKLRGATPLFGYPTQAEAVTQLRRWLLGLG